MPFESGADLEFFSQALLARTPHGPSRIRLPASEPGLKLELGDPVYGHATGLAAGSMTAHGSGTRGPLIGHVDEFASAGIYIL